MFVGKARVVQTVSYQGARLSSAFLITHSSSTGSERACVWEFAPMDMRPPV